MAVGTDAKALVEALSDSGRFSSVVTKKARVINIEGTTAWVSVIGGAPRTPCTMAVSCKANDYVMVTFADSRAIVTSNVTAPATDDTEADAARELADVATIEASRAYSSAQVAEGAAVAAERSATEASVSARQAFSYLLDVEDDWEAIDEYRQEAGATVAEIAEDAEQAATDAANAETSARTAAEQALSASISASAALGRLSDVENVVGALNWISEHGEYVSAAGTDFDSERAYYGYDSTLGVYYRISNPVPESLSSYYVLNVTESVEQYIASHASMTNDGLWLTGDSNRHSVLVSSGGGNYDAGMHVISDGRVVASYGETTVIGDATKAHIEIDDSSVSFKTVDGTEVAYIAVDETTGESMFYMTRAVVVKDLRFGNWKWADRSNGNMALKWMGE